jgi:hypothetical protein
MSKIQKLVTSLVLVFAMMVSFLTISSANTAELYVVATAKKSGLCKNENAQKVTGKWQNFGGCEPFKLNGDRSLFFAQLHINCTKRPKYVKIRFARLLPNGKRDTTGTTTFSFTKNTTRDWQGTTWWEMKTKHPIVAQYKVVGGKCYSDQRQVKWWQP